MTPMQPLSPEDLGREMAVMVCESVREQLRIDPEMIASVVGLAFSGTWAGVHHFTAPAEGLSGVRYERASTPSDDGET